MPPHPLLHQHVSSKFRGQTVASPAMCAPRGCHLTVEQISSIQLRLPTSATLEAEAAPGRPLHASNRAH